MNQHHWRAWWMAGATACTLLAAQADETAVVQAERVNVRGKPSTFGEVVTQLKRGETVTVLEEIPTAKPKPGEPAKWAKIKMPENTPLWVNASFIDPTNKTVKVKRLNVRAGAGENYSVVGRLAQGDVVKEIRVVDDWMEIETPTNTYAYVAADLIQKPESTPAATEPPKTAEP
ncbi:MAG: SH3 domain-containing protein, partial [Verrucomicrobia bacterium]|nr:SH3 domain-containing protein [Verrucomicrobiota bacterium]